MERVAVDFWRWPRHECSADIRSDLGQASNAGQRQKRRNPPGASQKGRLVASLVRCSSLKGMRLICSLPSAPSASTRDPSQYFNSLLRLYQHRCPNVGGVIKLARFPIRHSNAAMRRRLPWQVALVQSVARRELEKVGHRGAYEVGMRWF